MQPWCPQRLPFQSYLYRVIREYRLLVIITLVKANALTMSNVYGGDYFYCNLPLTAIAVLLLSINKASYWLLKRAIIDLYWNTFSTVWREMLYYLYFYLPEYLALY